MNIINKITGRKKSSDNDVDPETGRGVLRVQSARKDDQAWRGDGPNNPDTTQTPKNETMYGSSSSQVSTTALPPGVHTPQKRKKKLKIRPKKQLDKVWRKTSKGLTPPSYFCSIFLALCGLICLVSGLVMTIMGHNVEPYQENTPAANFMRVGGGIFVVCGLIIMLAGLFYFILVYLRHNGVLNGKGDEKASHPKVESESESESETDLGQKGQINNGYAITREKGSDHNLTTQKQQVYYAKQNTRDIDQSKDSLASDKGITFNTNDERYESLQSLPSNVNVLQGSAAIPRLAMRRQSVAIGEGIYNAGNNSGDIFKIPEAKDRNVSQTDIPRNVVGRSQREPPSFYSLNPKLPPISTGTRQPIEATHNTTSPVTGLNKLDDIITDAPDTSNLNRRRMSLFETSPIAPGSVTTPKILKKSQSSFDMNNMADVARTPLSARRPAEAQMPPSSVLGRRDSVNMYIRNK